MKKLKNLIESKWLVDDENKASLGTDEKRAFVEAVARFNEYGDMLRAHSQLKETAQTIAKIVEMAPHIAQLTEDDDWFDGVTVGRHMKQLGEAHKVFNKTAQELSVAQRRMEAAYEDIGGTLNKYFNINEITEDLDKPGEEDADIDNDGDVDDSDAYINNKRDAIEDAMEDEELDEGNGKSASEAQVTDMISDIRNIAIELKTNPAKKIIHRSASDIIKKLNDFRNILRRVDK